jgi:hypothetical protein
MDSKMIQCQVKTKVYLVKPKDLDYPQKFLLRVVATQIPKPRYPKPIFLSTLSKSRGRDFF